MGILARMMCKNHEYEWTGSNFDFSDEWTCKKCGKEVYEEPEANKIKREATKVESDKIWNEIFSNIRSIKK